MFQLVLKFLLIFIITSGCSFDSKTGIWGGSEKEKRRISEMERAQRQVISKEKIYSSDESYTNEIDLSNTIDISKPKINLDWKMAGLNHQNFLGNIYLTGIDNNFLKKKNRKK